MRLLIMLLLIGGLLNLQYELWFGNSGFLETRLFERQIVQQQVKNQKLQQQNSALVAEVLNLKQGLEAVESEARTELGLIKTGERFYQFIDAGAVAQIAPEAP